MNRRQIERRVAHLERLVQEQPAAFRLRVTGLAMLGYGYVLGLLTLTLAFFITCIWLWFHGQADRGLLIHLIIGSGFLLFIIGSAVLLRPQPPPGVPLPQQDAPRLWNEVEAARLAVLGPPLTALILDATPSTRLHALPRWGWLGPPQYYLTLGFPLLIALSPDDLRPLLGREIARYSRSRGRLDGWLTRLRDTWTIIDAAAQGGWARLWLSPFQYWYQPILDRWTAVLSRQQETDADDYAARIFGPHRLADSLVKQALLEQLYSNDFLNAQLINPDTTSQNVLTRFPSWWSTTGRAVPPAPLLIRLQRKITLPLDLSPALRQRLLRVAHPSPQPTWTPQDGLRVFFLGSAPDTSLRIARDLGRQFFSDWPAQATQARALARELDQIHSRHQAGESLDSEELWRLAFLSESMGRLEDARAFYAEHARRFPDDPATLHALARIELDADRPLGLSLMRRAISLDSSYGADGLDRMIISLRRCGRHADAEPLLDAYDHMVSLDQQARAERWNISKKDRFLPHQFPPDALRRLISILHAEPKVGRAWLVRKKITIHPNHPCHVLALECDAVWWKYVSEDDETTLALAVARRLDFRQDIILLTLQGGKKKRVWNTITRVEGALIYQRQPAAPTHSRSAKAHT